MGPIDDLSTETLYWHRSDGTTFTFDDILGVRPVRADGTPGDEFDAILAVVANTAWGVNHNV